jgi:N6-L-threonylcarbamoyladenine synthase
MLVLGVETSCDETGLAVVENGRLLGQRLASQADLHAVYGGVVPELASREHLRALDPLWQALLQDTGLDPDSFDALAVARGPGLLGSLLVGLGFAKGLAFSIQADLVGVDHLLAHLLAPGLEVEIPFPSLGLLVSGGHTRLYLLTGPTQAKLLGTTLDDAAGEAFDKLAKLLNIPYPGGQYVDLLAGLSEPKPDLLPVPYVDNQNLDFSFSGVKTAAARVIKEHELGFASMPAPKEVLACGQGHPDLARLCASFNEVVVRALRIKAARALNSLPQARGLIVAGGVAANGLLRREMADLASQAGVRLILPSLELCTDNAAMVAYTGWLHLSAGLRHSLGLEAVPRGQVIPWDYE